MTKCSLLIEIKANVSFAILNFKPEYHIHFLYSTKLIHATTKSISCRTISKNRLSRFIQYVLGKTTARPIWSFSCLFSAKSESSFFVVRVRVDWLSAWSQNLQHHKESLLSSLRLCLEYNSQLHLHYNQKTRFCRESKLGQQKYKVGLFFLPE